MNFTLNGIPTAIATSSAGAVLFNLNPLAGAGVGILIQQLFAPVVDPIMDTLENSSKNGKNIVTSNIIELTSFLSCVSTGLLCTQIPDSFKSPVTGIAIGALIYGVNTLTAKPLADKAGSLASQSLEKISTASSITFCALKTIASWQALSYLQNNLELTNSQLHTVISSALAIHLATTYFFN